MSTVQDPLGSVQDIFESLLKHQESHRRAELDSRQCLSGPHKDDLVVELDGQSAKQFGSQGQDPDSGPVPETGSAGNFSAGDRRVGPCCCWTTCCLNWTENGNPLY